MGVVEGGVTGEILIPKGEWITGCPPGGEGEGKGRGLWARAGVDWREDRAGERELTDWGADKGALTGVPAWDFCGEDGCFGVLEEDDEDEDEDEDEFELDDGEATMGESHDVDAEDGAGVGESRLMTSPNAFDDMGWGESHSLSVSESSSELIVKSITSILGFFGAGPKNHSINFNISLNLNKACIFLLSKTLVVLMLSYMENNYNIVNQLLFTCYKFLSGSRESDHRKYFSVFLT